MAIIFEYSEVHVLQQKDQNLSLANMTKSANDNMMTRPHWTGAGRPACMEKDRNTAADNRPASV